MGDKDDDIIHAGIEELSKLGGGKNFRNGFQAHCLPIYFVCTLINYSLLHFAGSQGSRVHTINCLFVRIFFLKG